MDLDTQATYLKIIEDNFKGMKNMLDHIRESITQYPVYTQLEFMKPIQGIIFEALQDATDDNNKVLNNYDGGDSIDINDVV